MALRKNIVASYLSQFYVTVSGILFLPLYVKYMGAEAYGLVGFFTMLQSLFTLLDVGLTPTMARETARFRGGALTATDYRRFFHALESVFVVVALLGALLLWVSSGVISEQWLNRASLSAHAVKASLELMALAVSCRWVSGFYRGVISGSEKIAWLSAYNSLIATLRFAGVIIILSEISATPYAFFLYQLVLGVIELVGLAFYAYRILPSSEVAHRVTGIDWSVLRGSLSFSLTVAFTSAAWIMLTQLDKLVLSKILTLADYGRFTLAVLLASAVTVVTGPVSSALMPRMARLEAGHDHISVIEVYRKCTQLVCVIAGSAAVVLAVLAEDVLWVWTKDQSLAVSVGPILRLYALGNGVLAVAAFPYYLQYARGDLRLHVYGNVLLLILLIPSILWAASKYGGVGAGYAWLTSNIIYFIFWVPFVHKRLAPGLHAVWLTKDVVRIFFGSAVCGCCTLYIATPFELNREWSIFRLAVVGLVTLAASGSMSSYFRQSASIYIDKLVRTRKRSD